MDVVSDLLFDDRPCRILTIVDRHTKETFATTASTKLGVYWVVEKLDRPAEIEGKPCIQINDDRDDHGRGGGRASAKTNLPGGI